MLSQQAQKDAHTSRLFFNKVRLFPQYRCGEVLVEQNEIGPMKDHGRSGLLQLPHISRPRGVSVMGAATKTEVLDRHRNDRLTDLINRKLDIQDLCTRDSQACDTSH